MQTVLSLVKDNALRTIDDIGSLLLSTHGGKAIHELGSGSSLAHQLGVDLIRQKLIESLLSLLTLHAITHPRIGVDKVHTVHGLLGSVANLDGTSIRRSGRQLGTFIENTLLDGKVFPLGPATRTSMPMMQPVLIRS